MLRKNSNPNTVNDGARIAIVASKYNGEYVDAMVNAAREELHKAGAHVRVVRVPGAFEIPAVAASLAAKRRYEAIICLGVIFEGETSHAQHIGEGVTHALTQIQVAYQVPTIHGVFVFEKKKQAAARCLDPKFNRGIEAAHTALAMAQVMRDVNRTGTASVKSRVKEQSNPRRRKSRLSVSLR